MKRFKSDELRTSDASPEAGAQVFQDTKDDGDVYVGHSDFSNNLKKDSNEEIFEWREVVRG